MNCRREDHSWVVLDSDGSCNFCKVTRKNEINQRQAILFNKSLKGEISKEAYLHLSIICKATGIPHSSSDWNFPWVAQKFMESCVKFYRLGNKKIKLKNKNGKDKLLRRLKDAEEVRFIYLQRIRKLEKCLTETKRLNLIDLKFLKEHQRLEEENQKLKKARNKNANTTKKRN